MIWILNMGGNFKVYTIPPYEEIKFSKSFRKVILLILLTVHSEGKWEQFGKNALIIHLHVRMI